MMSHEEAQALRAHPMAGWVSVVPVEPPSETTGPRTRDVGGAFTLIELDLSPGIHAGIVAEVGPGFDRFAPEEPMHPGDKVFYQHPAAIRVGDLVFVAFQGLVAKLGQDEG